MLPAALQSDEPIKDSDLASPAASVTMQDSSCPHGGRQQEQTQLERREAQHQFNTSKQTWLVDQKGRREQITPKIEDRNLLQERCTRQLPEAKISFLALQRNGDNMRMKKGHTEVHLPPPTPQIHPHAYKP